LNRDLRKVIIVDFDEKSYQLQDRNGFKLKKYEGDDDETLADLTHFLQGKTMFHDKLMSGHVI